MDLSNVQPLLDWIAANPALAGIVICFVAAFESLALVGILVPGIAFMLGIGTLVGLDALPLETTLMWAALGAVIGDGVSFWLGRHYDRQLRHVWPLSRYPALIPKGERFFRKHGSASILFGRFVGPMRAIIPAVAGIMHMDPIRFYIINIISAILWAPAVILPGVLFGESLQLASEVVYRMALFVGVIIVAAGMLVWLMNRITGALIEESFDTLSALVFKHMGKTGLVSVIIFISGLVSVSIYITSISSELESARTVKEIKRELWWRSGWEQFNPESYMASGHSFNIQWWGALSAIESGLLALHWEKSKGLNLKNALTYFTPGESGEYLPMLSSKYRDQKPALEMVKKENQQISRFLLMRLWQVDTTQNASSIQLWVGTVEYIDEISVFNLARFPRKTGDYEQAIAAMDDIFMRTEKPPAYRVNVYSGAMKKQQWHGSVMLIDLN